MAAAEVRRRSEKQRRVRFAVSLLLAAGWLALIPLVNNDERALAVMIFATFVLGLGVGRWWVLVVPLVALVAGTIFNAVTWDASSEDTFGGIEELFIGLTLFAEFLLAISVGFRWVLRRLD